MRHWVMAEEDLLAMLKRAHNGDDPELPLVEMYANSEADES